MTRISEARTCRVEISSDRSSMEGGDRSRWIGIMNRRIDDGRLYAQRRLEGAGGRVGAGAFVTVNYSTKRW